MTSTRWSVLLGGSLLASLPTQAHGKTAIGPSDRLMAAPSTQLSLELGAALGQAVPFSIAPADRAWLALSGRWQIADPVHLRLSYQGLAARWPSGSTAIGSGDLRLGTRARAWQGGRDQAWSAGLDWEVKLPNADDTRGLGTDETDVSTRAWLAWTDQRLALQLDGGLAILGDPLQDSAQDAAALLGLRGALDLAPSSARLDSSLDARLDARLPSPRNPAEVELALGLGAGPRSSRVRGRLEGTVGLTPAAPDLGLRLSLALVPLPDGA